MIDTLISSKTRVKLLLNSKTKAYLRSLESEFGESSNAIRVELNRMERAGISKSAAIGNNKYFRQTLIILSLKKS